MDYFEKITKESESSLGSLKKIGVSINTNCRFYQHIKYLKEVAKIHSTTKNYDYKKGFAIYKILYSIQELQNLLFINNNLVSIFDSFRDDFKKSIIAKINIMVSGATYTEKEKDTSARDAEFELFLMAKLCQKGFIDIDTYNRPDVSLNINSRIYGFECKRIIGNAESGLIRRAEEATKQIINSEINLFTGIVALDVCSFIHDNSWNIGKNKDEINNNIIQTLKNCAKIVTSKCPRFIKNAQTNVISGLLLRISVPYIAEDDDIGVSTIMLNIYFNENSPIAIQYHNDLKPFLIEYSSGKGH